MKAAPEVVVTSFCPRCDNAYQASSKPAADSLVRDHIKIQIDELHEGALEEWDDD